MYCAYVPDRMPVRPYTRSPERNRVTPFPTCSTSPARTIPRIWLRGRIAERQAHEEPLPPAGEAEAIASVRVAHGHARRVHLDEDLALLGSRPRDVPHLQHFGRPVGRAHGSFHDSDSTARARRRHIRSV